MNRATIFMTAGLLAVAFSASAAEKRPLRWQLDPGDVFHVEFRQRVSHADSVSSTVARTLGGRAQNSTHDLAFQFSWKVVDATDASTDNYRQYPRLELAQTLKRVVLDFQFGGLSRTRYDSAKPPEDAGVGRVFETAVHQKCQEYLDKPTKIYLTQRGRLVYDSDAIKRIADSASEWFIKSQLSGDDMGSLMQTLLPQFPVEANRRQPWQREVTLHFGELVNTGKMIYTYTPQASRGSNVRIRLDGKRKNEAARGIGVLAGTQAAGHKCTGEIRFDANRGHVTTAKLHEVALEDFGGSIRNRYEKSVQLTIRRALANRPK